MGPCWWHILYLDGKEVARQRIGHTVPGRFGIDTFDVGCDTGSPVSKAYAPPFSFTGVIKQVDIHIGHPGVSDDERVLHAKFTAGKDY